MCFLKLPSYSLPLFLFLLSHGQASGGIETKVCLISHSSNSIYALSRNHTLKSKYGTLERGVVVVNRGGQLMMTQEMVMVKTSNKRLFMEEVSRWWWWWWSLGMERESIG